MPRWPRDDLNFLLYKNASVKIPKYLHAKGELNIEVKATEMSHIYIVGSTHPSFAVVVLEVQMVGKCQVDLVTGWKSCINAKVVDWSKTMQCRLRIIKDLLTQECPHNLRLLRKTCGIATLM